MWLCMCVRVYMRVRMHIAGSHRVRDQLAFALTPRVPLRFGAWRRSWELGGERAVSQGKNSVLWLMLFLPG